MYFDFSTEKVSRLLAVIGIMFVSVYAIVSAYPNFSVTYINDWTGSYANRSKATLAYWWSYKLPTEGNAYGVNPVQAIASPLGSFFAGIRERLGGAPVHDSTAYAAAANGAGVARSIPVLLYHGESAESQNIPLERFVTQMRAIKEAGWHTITMEQFYAFVKSGTPLPDKSFLLTFDDGRKDSYYPTDPVLQDLGFNAVMFVVTGYSMPSDTSKKSTFYLSKTELHEMQNTGRWELESHGKEDHVFYYVDGKGTEGHFLSNKLWLPDTKTLESEAVFKQRITSDLAAAKSSLEKEFGKPVIAFAYPFSDYGQDSINFKGSKPIVNDVVGSLYQLAFYQATFADGDSFNYPASKNYMVKRIEPRSNWDGAAVVAALESGRAKELPYTSESFGQEWLQTWGTVTKNGGMLSLAANPDTTGAATFLNGSGWWKNYSLSITVARRTGSDIMLMARHQDSNNYVLCAFSGSRVALRENLGGVPRILGSEKHTFATKTGSAVLGMNVTDDSAECLVDGKVVTHGEMISPALRQGGVGVQVWDERKDTASARIESISILPLE